MILKKGQTVQLACGGATVDGRLGSGAYATVYRVSLPNGSKAALKLFHKELADSLGRDFRENVINLIRFGSPGGMFIWPREAVQLPDGTWGYLMDAAPKGFITLGKALDEGKLKWRMMAQCCIRLLGGLQHLHTKQLSYKDISPDNFLVQPDSGQLLIIDCENISIAGTAGMCVRGGNVGHVKGTAGFIAPELLDGAEHNVETDRFAFASLLFQMFVNAEPYCGRAYLACRTPQEANEYLKHPVFMFDEADPSNKPENEAAVTAWSMLPAGIQAAFRLAFGPRPDQRPDCREWASLLLRWLAEGIGCPCGLLLSRSILAAEAGSGRVECPFCKTSFRLPPTLFIESRKPSAVSLIPGRPVYSACVSREGDPFSLEAAGVVSKHPRDPRQLILVCQQERGWMKSDANGVKPVAKGQGAVIKDGLKIAFPHGYIGTIRT